MNRTYPAVGAGATKLQRAQAALNFGEAIVDTIQSEITRRLWTTSSCRRMTL